jgi:hypothetical protein
LSIKNRTTRQKPSSRLNLAQKDDLATSGFFFLFFLFQTALISLLSTQQNTIFVCREFIYQIDLTILPVLDSPPVYTLHRVQESVFRAAEALENTCKGKKK